MSWVGPSRSKTSSPESALYEAQLEKLKQQLISSEHRASLLTRQNADLERELNELKSQLLGPAGTGLSERLAELFPNYEHQVTVFLNSSATPYREDRWSVSLAQGTVVVSAEADNLTELLTLLVRGVRQIGGGVKSEISQ